MPGSGLKTLVVVITLATAAQVDLKDAAMIAADSLNAFGLMTDKPEALAKNFSRMSNVLSRVCRADDAVDIDSTGLSIEEVVKQMERCVKERLVARNS